MLKPENVNITIEQVAGSEVVLLTESREIFKYENGQRTDVSDGFRNTVVAPSNKYEQFTVKTPTAVVTPEQLAAAKDGVLKVRIKGFVGRFYRTRTGEYAFTSTAESMEVVN